MTMTLSRVNSSAATLTKNRTEDSVTPASGMCVTCVDAGVTDSSVLFFVKVAD